MSLAPPLSPAATLRWSIVRSILDELAPRSVLEIGCGQGGFGARIASRARYVGVESDAEAFGTARHRIEAAGGRVVHGTVDLIDEAERFDVICAFEVLEHIEDDLAALAGWMEWLVPGGSVVVSVPAWPDRFGPWDERVGHFRRYRPDQLDALLVAAGCDRVRHTLYGWPLGFATEAVRDFLAGRRGGATDTSMADRTARSGRSLQPHRALSGVALQVGTAPFVSLQKLRPTVGTGLVGIGHHKPS